MSTPERKAAPAAIAVVGVDALLPGADGADAWIATDAPAFREVPAGRWPGALPVAPAGTPDAVPTRVGAFLDGPDSDADGRDVSFAWVERVVGRVLPDGVDRERTSLDLAALLLPSTGNARAWRGRGHPDDLRQAELPALRAGRSSGLGGPIETLDAACASGLFALGHAVGRLRRGEVDCAVAAAVNRADSTYLFQGFGHLRALSPTGRSRPFDAGADGLLVGEGAAAVALMRLDDARRRGLRIHAVVRGVGLGSDGRKGNMLAPSEPGQLRAMRAAWRDAGLDPATVGLVECHATGTPLGDRTELASLEALLADRRGPPVVLSSAKALVGHTVTVAGLAGFLRAVGAVRDGFLPPAVGCAEPRPELARSRALTVLGERAPWEGPKRAAVSAFGFGGTDAHVVLEAAGDDEGVVLVSPPAPELAVVAAIGQVGPHRGEALLEALRTRAPLGPTTVGLPERFRIPPVELRQMLPQQRLALDLADEALAGLGLDPERTGAVIGIEVDPGVTAAVVRAMLRAEGADGDAADAPLTTDRVQGSLPSFVAGRIAAQLDLRGPCLVVGGGADAGAAALRRAAAMLAEPDLDAVVVGAIDTDARRRPGRDEGGVVLVVRRATETEPQERLATVRAGWVAPSGGVGEAGAAQALVDVLRALATGAPTEVGGARVTPRPAPFVGRFGGEEVPRPLPCSPELPPAPALLLSGAWSPSPAPFPWPTIPVAPRHPPAVAPSPFPPGEGGGGDGVGKARSAWESEVAVVAPGLAARLLPTSAGLTDLAGSVARAAAAVADAHARYLAAQEVAVDGLARLVGVWPAPTVARPAPTVARPVPPVPRSFDRAALLAHAGGRISEVFGPTYADLDPYEPRVRMPLPPLLLCDRVVTVEGERGGRGPARIVTEYDVPPGRDWTADGKPPAFVVVESGQADLFLVSFLGIDAECRGGRVYRLLDCDLEFAGPRPEVGTTLRHDIRIDRFARLGATTLFYFRYDCVDAATGRPVLRMRNGCAGFFTPAELASPRGLGEAPPDVGPGAPPDPSFVAVDGGLGLPPNADWRLVHRVARLTTSGGPHGLGEVVFEQDLRDDDWFNACHFLGDPCMPGTLMYEGCLQAVQVWLLGAGVGATHPRGRFEPVAGLATKLRCRGQVVPGHQKLTYHARIKEASLDGDPFAVADVTLSVDGVPVVSAVDVGVRVDGPRAPVRTGPVVGRDRVLEYSVGSAARAFGPAYAAFDGPERRCARMPGPPLLQMTEVLAVEGAAGEVAAPRSVTIAYDVPEDAWFWRAVEGVHPGAMPWIVLLETALQPCGWLTAWQAAGILGGADLYFRNLGGSAVQHLPVGPETGRLVTTARQTSVSASGGMQVQRFAIEVRSGDGLVLTCETQFGYFTKAALAAQKGLKDGGEAPRDAAIELRGHPALPRDDLRTIDRVLHADPRGGRAGLGRYLAVKDVDPGEWFFTAHFWLDPVMPGSLGLEALLELARWVFRERTGVDAPVEPLPLGREVQWTYRGQVLATNREMAVELEVLELDARGLRCAGVVRADGLPIYRFEDFGVRVAPELPRAVPARPRVRRAAALIETFERLDDRQGVGRIRLDPASHPWLDAHRPTLAAAAVPLAFSVEIAAEAATLLVPGATVRGVPEARAERWIVGPSELTVVAVREGDAVAVTLATGREVGARVVVRLGGLHAPSEPPPIEGEAVAWDGPAFFAAGHTFHGEVLQGMARLDVLGPAGARATLRTRPDEDLLGVEGLGFVLDPLLLDAATHPMMSGSPERWVPGLAEGKLAYPVRLEGLEVFGPRPSGDVACAVRLVSADARGLAFDVHLAGWCRYRWVETLVPGGPVLGQPAPVRRAFLWEGRGVPEVVIGRPVGDAGWEVRRGDVVEPLPGTLVAIYGSQGAQVPLRELAAKEAVRRWLRERGHEVHPRDLALAELRPGVLIVAEAPALDAAAYVRHLHPTRVVIRVEGDDRSWRATVGAP